MVGPSSIYFRKLCLTVFGKLLSCLPVPVLPFQQTPGRFKFLIRTRVCDLETSSRYSKRTVVPSFTLSGWWVTNSCHNVTLPDLSSDPDLHTQWDSRPGRTGAPYIWAVPSHEGQPLLFFLACLYWEPCIQSSPNIHMTTGAAPSC